MRLVHFYKKSLIMGRLGDEKRQEKQNNKEKFLEAFAGQGYNITKTAKLIGVHRNTILKWRNEDEEFDRAFKEAKESKTDVAEERVYLLMCGIPETDENGKLIGWKEKPHFGALRMYLATQARDRGYGEHLTIVREEENHDVKSDEQLLREIEEMKSKFLDEEEDEYDN